MAHVDSTNDVVRSSVKVPEFDRHLKKAGGHIGRNVGEISMKMKTIVWKPFMIKKSIEDFRHFCFRSAKNALVGVCLSKKIILEIKVDFYLSWS